MLPVKKHIKNNLAVILIALPNLAITTGTITLLSYFWHWSFVLAPTVYYLIGQVLSVQYSALFNRVTRTSLRVGKHTYRFDEDKTEPRNP